MKAQHLEALAERNSERPLTDSEIQDCLTKAAARLRILEAVETLSKAGYVVALDPAEEGGRGHHCYDAC